MTTPTSSTPLNVTMILRTALQDYLVPEKEYNSVEFDAIFGRMTVTELAQEILGRLAATTPAAIQPECPKCNPVRCVICQADEPHTGTCGSDDPRALCNRAPATSNVEAANERLTEKFADTIADAWQALNEIGYGVGNSSIKLGDAIRAIARKAAPIEAGELDSEIQQALDDVADLTMPKDKWISISNTLHHARQALTRRATKPESVTGAPIGYRIVKCGTFIGAAEWAATERNQKLVASGEVVPVHKPTAPTVDAVNNNNLTNKE